jgi:hypothetical protein
MSTVFSTDELHDRAAEVLATVERGEEVSALLTDPGTEV